MVDRVDDVSGPVSLDSEPLSYHKLMEWGDSGLDPVMAFHNWLNIGIRWMELLYYTVSCSCTTTRSRGLSLMGTRPTGLCQLEKCSSSRADAYKLIKLPKVSLVNLLNIIL